DPAQLRVTASKQAPQLFNRQKLKIEVSDAHLGRCLLERISRPLPPDGNTITPCEVFLTCEVSICNLHFGHCFSAGQHNATETSSFAAVWRHARRQGHLCSRCTYRAFTR